MLIVLEALGLSAAGKMTDEGKVVNPEQTFGSESRVTWKSGLNSHISFVSIFALIHLVEMCVCVSV